MFRRRSNDYSGLPTTAIPSSTCSVGSISSTGTGNGSGTGSAESTGAYYYYNTSGGGAAVSGTSASETTIAKPRRSFPWFFLRGGSSRRYVDGSAKSIRLRRPSKSFWQLWREAHRATKVTYILTFGFLLMIYGGVRALRYQYATIGLNCHMSDCTITIRPVGWKRKSSITIPRRQLLSTLAVKTTFDGSYISSNPSLHETYHPPTPAKSPKNKNKPKHSVPASSSITYKGPDENGHYVTYALALLDGSSEGNDNNNNSSTTIQAIKEGEEEGTEEERKLEDKDKQEGEDAKKQEQDSKGSSSSSSTNLVDLAPIQEYLQKLPTTSTTTDNENNTVTTEKQNDANNINNNVWYLTFHLFGISHTKRRVRTMMTRVDSYVKKRRQSVNVIESSEPSWVGLLLVVSGLLGFFLTLLLGQFSNEEDIQTSRQPQGPGARHYQQQQHGGGGRRHHSHPTASTTTAAATTTTSSSHNNNRLSSNSNHSSSNHNRKDATNNKNMARASSITTPYQRTTPARYEVKTQPATVNLQKQY